MPTLRLVRDSLLRGRRCDKNSGMVYVAVTTEYFVTGDLSEFCTEKSIFPFPFTLNGI